LRRQTPDGPIRTEGVLSYLRLRQAKNKQEEWEQIGFEKHRKSDSLGSQIPTGQNPDDQYECE